MQTAQVVAAQSPVTDLITLWVNVISLATLLQSFLVHFQQVSNAFQCVELFQIVIANVGYHSELPPASAR